MSTRTSTYLRWGLIFATAGVGLSILAILNRPVPIVRFATFDVALTRPGSGGLARDLESGDTQAQAVAEIIQRVAPDVLLLNGFDFDPQGEALATFVDRYLAVGQNGAAPIQYAHRFTAPVNAGVPSGADLDLDGSTGSRGDAFGRGSFPGQGGMALLSRYPILQEQVRTFQRLRWRAMPSARLPGTQGEEVREILRLSSRSHWDVPVRVSDSLVVHVLASHPVDPAAGSDPDASRVRNRDEIRFWADYIDPERSGYAVDDQGRSGGLAAGQEFVIMGNLNADPVDGASMPGAVAILLDHPRVQGDVAPRSDGAVEQERLQWAANSRHRGDASLDTADLDDFTGPGNLRLDYVLPSTGLQVDGSGVFWPTAADPRFRAVGTRPFPGSAHRLVWVDVRVDP